MAGLVQIGYEFVAAGVEAFKQAGDFVAESVAHINQTLAQTPQSIQTFQRGTSAMEGDLQSLRQELKDTQDAFVAGILGNAKTSTLTQLQGQMTRLSTAIRILQTDEKALDQEFANSQRAAANLSEQLGQRFTDAGRTATGSIRQIDERLQQLEKSLDRLRGLQSINIISTGKIDPNLASGIAEATKQITQLQQAQAVNLDKGLAGTFRELGAALAIVNPALGSTVTGLLSFVATATAVVSASAAIAGGLATIVVNAGLVKSIEFASNIEKESQFAKAVLQGTDDQINTLVATAEKLGSQFPVSFQNIIESLTEAGRAGINLDGLTEHIGALIESLTILGKGEIGPRQIAESLSASLVAFKAVGGTADDFAKSVVGVANATRLSIPEVVSGFNKLAPIASLLHLTEEETAAFIGIVGAAGLRGEEAGTGLRNFFLRLTKDAPQAEAVMRQFGISLFTATGAARPLGDVLKDLQDKFGNAAIDAGKMDDRTRLFALTTIFQTRSATAAALAITQGTEAYQAMLDVIENTDPIQQSAVAIDTLQGKLGLIKNKVGFAVNAFGQELLPSAKEVANKIDGILADAVNPDGKIRANITSIGKALNSLVSGAGTGQAQASIGSQFGAQAEAFFSNVSDAADKFKAVLTQGVIPAVEQFIAALSHLVLGTVFDQNAPNQFADAVTGVVGIVVGLIQTATLLITAIDDNREAIIDFGRQGVAAIGAIVSAMGSAFHALAQFEVSAGQFFQSLPQSPKPWFVDQEEWDKLSEGRTQFQKFGDNLVAGGTNLLNLGDAANTANDDMAKLVAGLNDLGRSRELAAELTKQINSLTDSLHEAEAAQLQPTGPDRSKDIAQLQELIGALQEQRDAVDHTSKAQADANSLASKAQGVYEKLRAAFKGTEGDTTSLSDAMREQTRVENAIKAETESLQRTYEEMSRSASKSVREVTDKLTDLADKTNREFDKLATELQQRLQEIQTNLQEANQTAVDAFNFNEFISSENKFINRFSQDLNTGISRSFRTISTSFSQFIEDRDATRQHDLELEQRHQQRIVDANLEAHQQITEDLERSIQEADQDRQRSFQRQQEQQIQGIQRQFDAQNLLRNRTLDDADRQKQLARDLSRATSGDDKKRVQDQFNDQTQLLKDQRAREDSENRIKLQQEDELTKKRQQQEDESVAQTRRTANSELAIRRNLADAEKDYREGVELDFLKFRWAQELDFHNKTRDLDKGDQTVRDQIQDQQTAVEREAADKAIKPLEDAVALQQFLNEQQNRQNEANKQSSQAVTNAQTKAGEMTQTFTENQDKIIRDGLQAIGDLGDRADQLATDALRKVGSTFPGLGSFTAGIAGLIDAGKSGVQAAVDAAPGLRIPDLGAVAGAVTPAQLSRPNISPEVQAALSLLDNKFGPPPTGTAITPQTLSTAATLKAAQSTIQLNQNVQRLLDFLQTQARGAGGAIGGIAVNVDDFANNGILVDSGTGSAVQRLASGIGGALASGIRLKGGLP